MRLTKPTILAATAFALVLASGASVGAAVEGRSFRASLDAADAAEQETIVLAVSGMT
jgi:hypothetical protein